MYIAETSPVLNGENNASVAQFNALSRAMIAGSIALDYEESESDEMAESNTLAHVNGEAAAPAGMTAG
ncbi:hypothetical protein [Streptomyces melanogenes]|uniref:Uncharacterized protein n=1 Tax=Streptomyces melanogenes TaxID=67326 RepID=A0ABZ1XB59_9ACTN|nr:hypothetical protein [Streptomyces melanogenes]